jgi:hypothetical protein
MLAENKNFWDNLSKIQNALLSSDEDFSQFLDVNHDYFIQQRNTLSFLPLGCVFELAERLNFHFEDLLKDNFSTKAIINNLCGNISIDEKYSVATYSTTRPIMNIINYLELVRGERAKISLLRKFQISESFLSNPNQKTNIHLISDAVKYLAKTYQLTHEDFIAMGRMAPLSITDNTLKNNLANKKNIYDLIDYFVNDCALLFDKNFTYRITSMQRNYAVIEATTNKNVLEELRLTPTEFGNEEVCLTRMGVLSSITQFKYGQYTQVSKIDSIYTGAKSHRYLIDLSPFTNLSGLTIRLADPQAIYH